MASPLELIINDRMGRKLRFQMDFSDTIADLKDKIVEKTGLSKRSIVLKSRSTIYRDEAAIQDYSSDPVYGLRNGSTIEAAVTFPEHLFK